MGNSVLDGKSVADVLVFYSLPYSTRTTLQLPSFVFFIGEEKCRGCIILATMNAVI
jgi:hypothetical protein